MLPPSLQDWLPEGHLAPFLSDVVTELDGSAIYQSYDEKDGRGQAAYHPVMMVKLLFYGYCVGVMSSRKIEAATYDPVAFRYLAADEHPDHASIRRPEIRNSVFDIQPIGRVRERPACRDLPERRKARTRRTSSRAFPSMPPPPPPEPARASGQRWHNCPH